MRRRARAATAHHKGQASLTWRPDTGGSAYPRGQTLTRLCSADPPASRGQQVSAMCAAPPKAEGPSRADQRGRKGEGRREHRQKATTTRCYLGCCPSAPASADTPRSGASRWGDVAKQGPPRPEFNPAKCGRHRHCRSGCRCRVPRTPRPPMSEDPRLRSLSAPAETHQHPPHPPAQSPLMGGADEERWPRGCRASSWAVRNVRTHWVFLGAQMGQVYPAQVV